jgi:hypothetical protein
MTHSLGGLARQLGTALLRVLSTPPEPWQPTQAPPRREYTRYARSGPRVDGLTPDQAALAAVERRGLPCHILDTARAEGLSTGRIGDACLALKHARDLADEVTAGNLSLAHAAIVARLRRDAPDLAAKVEPRLMIDAPITLPRH